MLDWHVFDRYQVTHQQHSQSNSIQYLTLPDPPQGYPATAVLKVLPKTTASLKECKTHLLLSRLNPSIVHCYCFRDDLKSENRLYLEHCQLGSLNEVYEVREDSPWKPEELVRMWSSMAGAVATMHEANFVHRDLKPGNFFVMRDGEVKLGDFGDATQKLEQDLNLLQSAVHGTISYFSPVQRRDFANVLVGRPSTQPNAECFENDMYSLGTTFCTMISMSPNLGRLSATWVETLGTKAAISVDVSLREPMFPHCPLKKKFPE